MNFVGIREVANEIDRQTYRHTTGREEKKREKIETKCRE
jgi:hypothetical protein